MTYPYTRRIKSLALLVALAFMTTSGAFAQARFTTVNAGTALQTNGVTRIDASGNMANAGTVTASGLITANGGVTGTTLTASGLSSLAGITASGTITANGAVQANSSFTVAASQTVNFNKDALTNIKLETIAAPTSADADKGRLYYDTGNNTVSVDRGSTLGGISSLWSLDTGNGISKSDSNGVRTVTVNADTSNEFAFTSGVLNLVYGSTAGLPADGSKTVGMASGSFTFGPTVTIGAGGTQLITPTWGAVAANSADLSGANGTATTFARSDHKHAIDVSIVPTWTGAHTHSNANLIVSGTGILQLTGTADGMELNKVAGNPSSLQEGEFWYDSTAKALKYRDNSATQTIANLNDSGQMRTGSVSCVSQALTKTVVLATAYSDASYYVTLGNSGANHVMAKVANKTSTGFDIQLEANPDTSTFDYITMR